jgi:DNA polymerase-4
VLVKYAPLVQSSSIDEWYCDLGGTEALYHGESLRDTAHRIRRAVHDATELDVSIGGGTSRLVAKMAVERAKPKPGTTADGVCCVEPGDEVRFLSTFKLADLPMVGPRFAASLEQRGLVTIAEAQQWSRERLVSTVGERAGSWLYDRIRGIDTSAVASRDHQKQVSREDTFARDLTDDDVIEKELLRLAVRVSADLRQLGLRARTITVKLRDKDFRTRSARRTLRLPIESERSVVRAASSLLTRLRADRRVPVRLLGIALSHFESDAGPGSALQLGLFGNDPPAPLADEPVEGERDRALTRALDRIRGRYGKDSILPAKLIDGKDDVGPRVEE